MIPILFRPRPLIKSALGRGLSVFGVSILDRETTKAAYLEPVADEIYRVNAETPPVITLSGVVRVGRTYLDIDYGSFSAFRINNLPYKSRRVYDKVVIPLWSHDWSGYYHWLIDVAPKLSAARQHFSSGISEVLFAYPRPLARYEIESAELLGIAPEQIVDPHKVGEIESDQMFVLPLSGWDSVSSRIHLLQQALISCCRPERRLYVSRAGRRRIVNETALFKMLEAHGFEFVPDRPRSVSDQIELFGSASHIVSPHGAALSNILWCNKRSKILELTNSLYSPRYYVNLASVLGLTFDRLSFGTKPHHWSNRDKNISVDVDIVDRFFREKWWF